MQKKRELVVHSSSSSFLKSMLSVIHTGHWLIGHMNSLLKPLDLTEPQFNVLSTLFFQKGKPVCSHEVQVRMVQRESNVTRIVDKLVAKGWATRIIDPENRRKVAIQITETGKARFKKASRKVASFYGPLEESITRNEAESISVVLRKIREASIEE